MTSIEPALDINVLNELAELLEDDLKELLNEYLADTPEQLRHLQEAVEGMVVSDIVSVTHSLKGSSGNLGVVGMFNRCQALEQDAKAGDVSDAAASLADIEMEFSRAKDALLKYMSD